MSTDIHSLNELKDLVGLHLGYSPWHLVDQEQIDSFAQATGDHQWIHVDQERSKVGPFGVTIAHGYLTLSLVTTLLPQILQVSGFSIGVNYGANKIRFPAPVPSGSRVHLGATLLAADEIVGGVQALFRVTIEVENSEKPSLVAEVIYRYYE